ERRADATTGVPDDDALEHLDALLLTLADAVVDLHLIPRAEREEIALEGGFEGGDLRNGVRHGAVTSKGRGWYHGDLAWSIGGTRSTSMLALGTLAPTLDAVDHHGKR